MSEKKAPSGPDLTAGVPLSALETHGQLLNHVGDEGVLVAKVNDEIFAATIGRDRESLLSEVELERQAGLLSA